MSNDKFPKSPSKAPLPTAKESQSVISETEIPPNEHETKLAADVDIRKDGITNDSLMSMVTNMSRTDQEHPVISDEVDKEFGPDPKPFSELEASPSAEEVLSDSHVITDTVRSVRKEKVKVNNALIDENWLGRGVIQAKPLSMPEMLSIKPHDPNIMFRWVNFKTEEGSRVTRHQMMGFSIASKEDVDGTIPLEIKEGTLGLICYDVVLMKIDKMRLLSAYEYNLQKSQRMVSRKSTHDKALEAAIAQLRADMNSNNTPAAYIRDRIEYFMPGEKEASALNR